VLGPHVGIAGFFLLVSCAAVQPATTPRPCTKLDGDYFSEHEVYVYDADKDEDVLAGVYADVLSVAEKAKHVLDVKIRVIGYNFSECVFDDTLVPSGPHQWNWQSRASGCELNLIQTPTAIVITSNWDCYNELCGSRATLEGEFLFSTRSPRGTIEWPER